MNSFPDHIDKSGGILTVGFIIESLNRGLKSPPF